MRWWPRCIASERISRAVLESKCISHIVGPFRLLDGPIAFQSNEDEVFLSVDPAFVLRYAPPSPARNAGLRNSPAPQGRT